MKPCPFGGLLCSKTCRSRLRSSSSSILCETPCFRIQGIITRYFPGSARYVLSVGPLVFMPSFVTCTAISWPLCRQFWIAGRSFKDLRLPMTSDWSVPAPGKWRGWRSLICKKPFLPTPISTNAACMPDSTFTTLPL